MILKQTWVIPEHYDHPELDCAPTNQKLLYLEFIDESSIEALSQKASNMRALQFFNEPYDPPEDSD
jgi:hypothetical protein